MAALPETQEKKKTFKMSRQSVWNNSLAYLLIICLETPFTALNSYNKSDVRLSYLPVIVLCFHFDDRCANDDTFADRLCVGCLVPCGIFEIAVDIDLDSPGGELEGGASIFDTNTNL